MSISSADIPYAARAVLIPLRLFDRRVRATAAVTLSAAIIGLVVGVLLAHSALQAPSRLRPRLGASEPVVGLRGPAAGDLGAVLDVAAPFAMPAANASDRLRAARCLADAIYYEAALEPIEGRRAVAQVVLNRVRDANFPKSVCAVVYEGWKSPPGCQFSFACDGSLARPPMPGLYREALDVAEQALKGHVEPRVGLATHYHAIAVDPVWCAQLVRVAQVGSQIFYRWPGAAGRAGAFTGRYAGAEQIPPAALAAREPSDPKPGGAAELAAPVEAEPLADDRAPFLYGRRIRSRGEIQAMNRWLEGKRPITGGTADASP